MMRSPLFFCAVGVVLAGCSGLQSSPQIPPASNGARQMMAHRQSGPSERIIYSFTGGIDGGDPAADLVFSKTGELYGTTVVGGSANCGTVFALTPRSSGPWQESQAYSFQCYSDGKNPYGGVLFDASGNAYGTTVSGGSGPSCGSTGCGVAYELQGSAETVLHDFTGGNDGFGPGGGLASDDHGHFYGTTPDGGKYNYGVVYELFKSARGWHERVIHAFTGGNDGAVGGLGRLLIQDAILNNGILGVTEGGGAHHAGTVFEITPTAKGFHFKTVYAFKGTPDCANPYGGLVDRGRSGFFGTTYYGGSDGVGCVFNVTASGNERVVYSFKGGSDGAYPTSTLLAAGTSLFGTTSTGGGSCNCGTIFKLTKGQETVVHDFSGGSDGSFPYYGLTKDSSGNLYGTTATGGTSGQGTVFEFGS